MYRSLRISSPSNTRHKMDPKFIFILFLVEIGSLIFDILNIGASELHVYSAYNQMPVVYLISSISHSCFPNINYCVYENTQLRFLKVLDLVFLSIIIICYACLFAIIVFKWENVKLRPNIKITWYAALQIIVLFALALDTLLMIILVERDTANTFQCSRQNRLVRVENLFNSFFLNIIEAAYIIFDLVNRQTSPKITSRQKLQYESEEAKTARLPPLEKDRRIMRTLQK